MTIIVNGEPRKTSYVARLYTLTDNGDDTHSVRVVASDGNPVTLEVQETGEDFKHYLRSQGSQHYIDVFARMEDEKESDKQGIYIYHESVQISLVSSSGETIAIGMLPGNMPTKQEQ